MDEKDVRVIKNLYWQQKAEIRFGNVTTARVDIQRGVRQGCILSPLLFNLYTDKIFKEAAGNLELGIKVNGVRINTIKYADDTVILAESIEELQLLLNKISEGGLRMGLNINTNKTKMMVFSLTRHENALLYLNGERIERVASIGYLGCLITEDLDPDREVRRRIEIARSVFNKMRAFFCDDNINLRLRRKMAKCYAWSVLLYGAEA